MYSASITIEEFNLLSDEDKIKIFSPITKCNKCTLEDGRITYEDLEVNDYHWDNYFDIDNAKKTKVIKAESAEHESPIEFAIQKTYKNKVVFNTNFDETDDDKDYPEIYKELLARKVKHAFYEGYIEKGIFFVTEAGSNNLDSIPETMNYSTVYRLAEFFVGRESPHVKMAHNLYIGTDVSEASNYKNSEVMFQLGI